jgi:hypothetical protein
VQERGVDGFLVQAVLDRVALKHLIGGGLEVIRERLQRRLQVVLVGGQRSRPGTRLPGRVAPLLLRQLKHRIERRKQLATAGN